MIFDTNFTHSEFDRMSVAIHFIAYGNREGFCSCLPGTTTPKSIGLKLDEIRANKNHSIKCVLRVEKEFWSEYNHIFTQTLSRMVQYLRGRYGDNHRDDMPYSSDNTILINYVCLTRRHYEDDYLIKRPLYVLRYCMKCIFMYRNYVCLKLHFS